MAKLLEMIFTAADLQTLLDQNPDKVLVRTTLEEVTLNNSTKAGAVRVFADAYQNGNPEPLATVNGCPLPPCNLSE